MSGDNLELFHEIQIGKSSFTFEELLELKHCARNMQLSYTGNMTYNQKDRCTDAAQKQTCKYQPEKYLADHRTDERYRLYHTNRSDFIHFYVPSLPKT